MKSLSIREAATKYGIPQRTLSDWVGDGLVRVMRKGERRGQPTLVFEDDVAQLAAHYKPGRSRWNRPSLEQVAS